MGGDDEPKAASKSSDDGALESAGAGSPDMLSGRSSHLTLGDSEMYSLAQRLKDCENSDHDMKKTKGARMRCAHVVRACLYSTRVPLYAVPLYTRAVVHACQRGHRAFVRVCAGGGARVIHSTLICPPFPPLPRVCVGGAQESTSIFPVIIHTSFERVCWDLFIGELEFQR